MDIGQDGCAMVAGGSRPRVSVIMPTYRQAAFLPRAVRSLQAQSMADWELLVVDDGSPDVTQQALEPFLADPRVRCYRFPRNRGLGAALNEGLGRARAAMVAYLPSDDVLYPEHLASLMAALDAHPDAILAFSGVRHHYNRAAEGAIPGETLQLVQAMHRRTADRWTEREDLVTDDLDRMFWSSLRRRGGTVGTGLVTCEWVDHPHQRHKILREPEGGINPYRVYYDVRTPLRFHSTAGNRIDEVERYRALRERPSTPLAPDGLKILLVGELAYNAERILALEERGHQLYGLWTPTPYWYNTVGPLPFGHVIDLPHERWREAIRELQPDVIYALLNWQAVPFAHSVLESSGDIPFVWHYKEGPFISLEKGHWRELLDLTRCSDGQIYSSPEMREWFLTVEPSLEGSPSLVLDGDLPKADWLRGERSDRLSAQDGSIHTVVPGRPIGLHAHTVGELAAQDIHLHFYGDFTHGQWRAWIDRARGFAPHHLHLHPNVDQERWVEEFSRYDAGWLHIFPSKNGGDLRRADWDDLNYPARMATLASAGLPMLQWDNRGTAVATQTLSRERDLGLFFSDWNELGTLLRDQEAVSRVQESVWRQRSEFTFDAHADRLLAFFHEIIRGAERRRANARTALDVGAR